MHDIIVNCHYDNENKTCRIIRIFTAGAQTCISKDINNKAEKENLNGNAVLLEVRFLLKSHEDFLV